MAGLPSIQAEQFAVSTSCNRNYCISRKLLAHDLANSPDHVLNRVLLLPKLAAGPVCLAQPFVCFSNLPLCLMRRERSLLHRGKVPRGVRAMLPILCDQLTVAMHRKILCHAQVQ